MGHASRAQGPNSRPVWTHSPTFATGSTHRKAPLPPKWPKVAGELDVPVQCGDLSPLISNPRPQSKGSNLPTPGRVPGRAGKVTVVASSSEGWIQQGRVEQLTGQSRHSDHAADQTLGRPAPQFGFDPQWCENSLL